MIDQAQAVAQRLRLMLGWETAAEGADTIDALCAEVERLTRWKSTNAPRLEALEGLLATAQKEASAGKEAAASLASEREANAILTAEVERLTKERAGLVQVSDLNADIAADLKAERDSLLTQLAQAQEDLHDERNRGLSLLADAKEWQRQFSEAQATIKTLRYEVDAIPAIKEERDAAQAENEQLSEGVKLRCYKCSDERMYYPKPRGTLSEEAHRIQTKTQLILERDAAQADAARMREALVKIKEHPQTHYMVGRITRAALQGETK